VDLVEGCAEGRSEDVVQRACGQRLLGDLARVLRLGAKARTGVVGPGGAWVAGALARMRACGFPAGLDARTGQAALDALAAVSEVAEGLNELERGPVAAPDRLAAALLRLKAAARDLAKGRRDLEARSTALAKPLPAAGGGARAELTRTKEAILACDVGGAQDGLRGAVERARLSLARRRQEEAGHKLELACLDAEIAAALAVSAGWSREAQSTVPARARGEAPGAYQSFYAAWARLHLAEERTAEAAAYLAALAGGCEVLADLERIATSFLSAHAELTARAEAAVAPAVACRAAEAEPALAALEELEETGCAQSLETPRAPGLREARAGAWMMCPALAVGPGEACPKEPAPVKQVCPWATGAKEPMPCPPGRCWDGVVCQQPVVVANSRRDPSGAVVCLEGYDEERDRCSSLLVACTAR
jgi:hypothetical protein